MAGQMALSVSPGQPTHEVRNQVPALYGNAFEDPALRQLLAHFGATWHEDLRELGQLVGSEEWQLKAAEANRQVPRLEAFDPRGFRQDAAVFHPSYHELMALGLRSGCSAFAWRHENARPGAHVIRGALMYLMYQLDQGVCCPLVMTFAAVPALRAANAEGGEFGGFVQDFARKLVSGEYCSKDLPLSQKTGATCGMSMTEKQGGSDVRANDTRATPVSAERPVPGDAFWLTGHKWFTSAPMSDAFLTLAQTQEGLSCFLVPRWLPDGRRNAGFNVQRLKEKLGDKSNASSEVEYRNAWGVLLGPLGRGVRTIVEMVVHTRLDCVIGSCALMRRSAQLACHHATHRWAFGKPLVKQPLMRQVLADLALESEAALAMWMRLARALESESEAAFARIATAISKYYVCRRAVPVAYEAMECHGGNGYAEGPMARLFRQSPLNAIWEGSGNVICLDILRALRREPESAEALLRELSSAETKAASALFAANGYGETLRAVKQRLAMEPEALEPYAREVADQLAVALQAATLLSFGDPKTAAAFLAARLPSAAAARGAVASHSMGATMARLPEELVEHLIQRLSLDPDLSRL
ncbi:unnamed protein product [Effrenium voratum]|uniref:Acyl-CoA dehydrogenase n=1 Tax=Effrenium voratum TaxID=2562239 RepID=A0AA36JKH2_9DINO|nr:unnamed protein product [Effrenium voratum]